MNWITKNEDCASKERLFDFIKKFDTKAEWIEEDKYGFSRTLGFEIIGQYYRIIWYHNLCTLCVGKETQRPLQASFDSIETDTCYPCYCGGNDNLTFRYRGNTILRIPLEVGFLSNENQKMEKRNIPFETFKSPVCKGSYSLGTACGHCEKCEWLKQNGGL